MTPGEQPLRCGVCGEAIGVYEPLVLVRSGRRPLVTSRAQEQLPAGVPALHRACFAGEVDEAA